jgi:XTP/dITP diphosphohydrolase
MDNSQLKIVFATNNEHKLQEIRQILGEKINVLSLNDIDCHTDIPETGLTMAENALQKAQYIYDHYHVSVFADDTGLEVDALGDAPGVYTARFASLKSPMPMLNGKFDAAHAEIDIHGKDHDSNANVDRLIDELRDNNNRNARFCTVIALISENGEVHEFEGIAEGTIIEERRGNGGFGYDPIFQPKGYQGTFAELGMDIKNKISHRARAVQKLADFLLNQ